MDDSSRQSTPKRRRITAQQLAANEGSQQSASPLRRGISRLSSFLSPWRGSATQSAAFGTPEPEEHAEEDSFTAQDLAPAQPNGGATFDFTFTPPAVPPYSEVVESAPITPTARPTNALDASRSPLSHNFDLLARFFAEKAAYEAGARPESENRLTEEEIRGCLDLIEQSGKTDHEVQRAVRGRISQGGRDPFSSRYRQTPRRSWLSPASHSLPLPQQDYTDLHSNLSNDASSAASDLRADMSISPEREGYASSYLAPLRSGRSSASGSDSQLARSTTEPAALFARSLTGNGSPAISSNPFLSGSTSTNAGLSTMASKKRRRPLYLGPGMSSSATSNAALRRRTLAQAATATPATSAQGPIATSPPSQAGLGKRQRVADPVAETTTTSPTDRSMPVENPLASSRSFTSIPASGRSSQVANHDSNANADPPTPRQQTRAANAALSILAEPDLPKHSPPRKFAGSAAKDKARLSTSLSALPDESDSATHTDSAFRPDTILNPYQAAPGLNLGKATASSSRKSRSSEAIEKMKDERRRSMRGRKSLAASTNQLDSSSTREEDDDGERDTDSTAPPSGSLLDEIERSQPISLRRKGTQHSKPSNEEVPEPPSTPQTKASSSSSFLSTTPGGTPPQSLVNAGKGDKAADSSKQASADDKTAEARRRLEAMKKSQELSKKQQDQQHSPASSTSSSKPLRAPSTPGFGGSTTFSHAHAPGKPSRLSIAFNANESPSSTGSTVGDDDDERVDVDGDTDASSKGKPSTPASAPFTFGTPSSSKPPTMASAPPSSSKPAFAFGSSGPAGASSTPASSVPSFSFGAVASQTTSNAAPPASTSTSSSPPQTLFSAATGKPAATTLPALSSTPPTLSFKPAPLPPLEESKQQAQAQEKTPAAAAETASDDRKRALSAAVSSLPTFDLQVDVTVFQGDVAGAAAADERAQAAKVSVDDLPRFDLSGSAKAAATTTAAAESAAQKTTAIPTGFSFKAPGESTTASTTAASSGWTSAASSAPQTPTASGFRSTSANGNSNEDAPSGGEDNSSSSSSALLGSGAGEEDETTSFEVRAKFWKFLSGKWEDCGVGIAKIKLRNGDGDGAGASTRRLLVRNAGNGQVTVNFNLFKDFKVTQTSNTLSFTGFDEQGKGLPMRCKVKTTESAGEFKGALEGE